MNDRELLDLAAKAAGFTITEEHAKALGLTPGKHFAGPGDSGIFLSWNPLINSDEALRMAVALGINLKFMFRHHEGGKMDRGVIANRVGDKEIELWGDDIVAATRRAIVRAAAEMAK